MNNQDDQCFKWAVTRAVNPLKDHPERISKQLRKHSETYNWKGIKFPAKFKDIKKSRDRTQVRI